jgi:hypothetical protein
MGAGVGLPISEQIALSVVDAVSSVQEANGYRYSLKVERQQRLGNSPEHLKAVVYQGSPTVEGEERFDTITWKLPFEILVYIITSETEKTAPDTYTNVVTADVQRAVLADYTRGGLAIDTNLAALEAFSEFDGKFDGAAMRFEVQYRTSRTDAYLSVG